MNLNEVSIATITWARDKAEEETLKTSLHHLSRLGIPVFITDGGSGSDFLSFLKSVPNFYVTATPMRGLWAQAKESLQQAYVAGSPFIFYTEPDKADFFIQSLTKLITHCKVNETTGIVLASRNKEGFASFPSFQQKTEAAINTCCAEVIGKVIDYTYGPFLLNRNLIPYLKTITEEIGWGWRPFAFNIAGRLGYSIEAFEGPFFCPPDQHEESKSERLYRIKQLHQNIQGLLLSTQLELNA